jgi:hypothetical protein
MIRSRWRSIVLLAACAVAGLTGLVRAQIAIARPNFGVPEFAEPGGAFRAEVKAGAGLSPDLWTAVLLNDLRAWTGAVERADYGLVADNNTVAGYRLSIRAPAGIPPETFRLALSHPAAGSATNRNAVGIVSNFETNFCILHYADPQAEAFEPSDPLTGRYGTHGSIREIYWHAPALGLINPRFLLDTGDELDNVYGTTTARYQEYIEAMCRIGVPVLATRGNNDNVISTAAWRSILGVETYSITMGSFYVCQKDYNENNFTTWFTNDYAASFTNPAVSYRLFGQHYNSGSAAWLPPAGRYPGLMLVGHGHVNATNQSSPYPILETRQACYKGSVGFFEFARTGSTWTCTSLADPWFQVMNTGPVARLAGTFARANDGTGSTNEITIVNGLSRTFSNGRVRFLAPYSSSGYVVSNGVKLAEYTYGGGSNAAIVTQVRIEGSATTRVSIRPADPDADGDGQPDAWEIACFGGTNAVLGGAGEDFDGDGLVNGYEYRAGTSPTNPASLLIVTGMEFAPDGRPVFSWSSASNRRYAILAGTNVNQGLIQVVASNLPAMPPYNSHTVDVPVTGARFFRVRLLEN